MRVNRRVLFLKFLNRHWMGIRWCQTPRLAWSLYVSIGSEKCKQVQLAATLNGLCVCVCVFHYPSRDFRLP